MTIQGNKSRRGRENRTIATKFSQGLCRVSRSATQSLDADTLTIVEFDTIDYDPNGWYSATAYTYTPKSPGTYMVIAHAATGSALTAGSYLGLYKNDSLLYMLDRCENTADTAMTGSCLVDMNGVSDYFTIKIYCHSGANITTGVDDNYLHVVQIGYNKP